MVFHVTRFHTARKSCHPKHFLIIITSSQQVFSFTQELTAVFRRSPFLQYTGLATKPRKEEEEKEGSGMREERGGRERGRGCNRENGNNSFPFAFLSLLSLPSPSLPHFPSLIHIRLLIFPSQIAFPSLSLFWLEPFSPKMKRGDSLPAVACKGLGEIM